MTFDTAVLPLSNHPCRICGQAPEDFVQPMNFGPVRFWEPDDGWIFSSLCRSCLFEHQAPPHPDDFAYPDQHDEVITIVDTDEDYTGIMLAF